MITQTELTWRRECLEDEVLFQLIYAGKITITARDLNSFLRKNKVTGHLRNIYFKSERINKSRLSKGKRNLYRGQKIFVVKPMSLFSSILLEHGNQETFLRKLENIGDLEKLSDSRFLTYKITDQGQSRVIPFISYGQGSKEKINEKLVQHIEEDLSQDQYREEELTVKKPKEKRIKRKLKEEEIILSEFEKNLLKEINSQVPHKESFQEMIIYGKQLREYRTHQPAFYSRYFKEKGFIEIRSKHWYVTKKGFEKLGLNQMDLF